jgi:hypothetical protein
MTQNECILKVLEDARGGWVNGRYFLQEMFLSQYHARISELRKKPDHYGYWGKIETSSFKDEYGFVSYRLVIPARQKMTEPLVDPFPPKKEVKVEKTGKLF